MRLHNKTAILTGAGSGLGAYTAKAFAREGAAVVVTDIDETLGRQVVQEIEAASGRAVFAPLDVTDEAAWARVTAAALDSFGKIDILVNSAGIVVSKSIEESTLEDLRKSFALNVEGPFLGIRAVAVQIGGGAFRQKRRQHPRQHRQSFLCAHAHAGIGLQRRTDSGLGKLCSAGTAGQS